MGENIYNITKYLFFCCSFELSIHFRLPPSKIVAKYVFNIDDNNKKCFLNSKSAY